MVAPRCDIEVTWTSAGAPPTPTGATEVRKVGIRVGCECNELARRLRRQPTRLRRAPSLASATNATQARTVACACNQRDSQKFESARLSAGDDRERPPTVTRASRRRRWAEGSDR